MGLRGPPGTEGKQVRGSGGTLVFSFSLLSVTHFCCGVVFCESKKNTTIPGQARAGGTKRIPGARGGDDFGGMKN